MGRRTGRGRTDDTAAVSRPSLEVADIFQRHGAAWRAAQAGHLSLGQLEVMAAIEACRTAALGGHVEACEECGHVRIAYNSCRNRHCPKCQAQARERWLHAREQMRKVLRFRQFVNFLPKFSNIFILTRRSDLLFAQCSCFLFDVCAQLRKLCIQCAKLHLQFWRA